jgi:hypothetical protein
MATRIHVNRQRIASNRKHGTSLPAIGVERPGRRKVYGHSVEILGPSRIVYRPQRPLACGARAWVETTSPVRVRRR